MTRRQVETRSVSIESIMRTAAFRHGVNDVRKGRTPRFDKWGDGDDWDYERGRQFGIIAPRDLEVVIQGRLNPNAVMFFRRHGSWGSEDIL
jgi:hypothetical protein